MYLIQLLLPMVDTGDATFGDAVSQTRDELIAQFGGLTVYSRSPAQGAWMAPRGGVERDTVVMAEVLVDTFDRQWWREYGARLAARFSQEQMHIRALPAETP